eukprot:sb/3478218/
MTTERLSETNVMGYFTLDSSKCQQTDRTWIIARTPSRIVTHAVQTHVQRERETNNNLTQSGHLRHTGAPKWAILERKRRVCDQSPSAPVYKGGLHICVIYRV